MSTGFDPEGLLRRTDAVLSTQLDGEVVLMSMEAGTCYGLDRIGSTIWELLQRPTTLASVQRVCRDSYEGDPARIYADVCDLVSKLLTERLIERVA